jgi:single stranded DNA-binding protein
MADTHVTITGNLTDNPELKHTGNGNLVANFRLVVTARVKDGDSWRDGDTSFFRINVWRQLAEHVAESLAKGDRAVVIGRLKSRSWETPRGRQALGGRGRGRRGRPLAAVGDRQARASRQRQGQGRVQRRRPVLIPARVRPGGCDPYRPRAPRAPEEVPGCTTNPTRPTSILSRPCTCWAASGSPPARPAGSSSPAPALKPAASAGPPVASARSVIRRAADGQSHHPPRHPRVLAANHQQGHAAGCAGHRRPGVPGHHLLQRPRPGPARPGRRPRGGGRPG